MKMKTVKTNEVKAGQEYLSKKGVPITVVTDKGDKVVVRVGSTDSKVELKKSELRPYDEKKVNKDSKLIIKANGNGQKHANPGKKSSGKSSLADIIAPYLFKGGLTTGEIAKELMKIESCKGKSLIDLKYNVWGRIVYYRNKGFKVIKDDKKRVKVISK